MRRGIGLIALMCAIAVGCASPSSKFYTLSASPVDLNASTPKLAVVVGPISIPATVDMPQIVVAKGLNQVAPDQFNLWASPLRSNIAQVVCANLAALLETSSVSSISSVSTINPDYRVAIDVQTFESAPGDAATLSALWVVRRVSDGKSTTGRTTVREPSLEKSYEALAAAHSRALKRLSVDVAEAIRALDRERS